jgi:hypothetical protein
MTRPKRTFDEVEDLRVATRAAHEAIQDLRAVMREAEQIKLEVITAASMAVTEGLSLAIRSGMDTYQRAISEAMEEAVTGIHKRFDTIADQLVGATNELGTEEVARAIVVMRQLREEGLDADQG